MREKRRSYESDEIEVTYDVKRCIHSAECTRGLPEVFDTSRRPWIQPEQSNADRIAGVIHKCPTGALKYNRKDGGPPEPTPKQNDFRLGADGPVYLRGDFYFTDESGEPVKTDTRIALCRCGKSRNKPYCDNTHEDIEWSASDTVPEQGKPDSDEASGKFILEPAVNGPMVCHGTIAALNPDGSTASVVENPTFCRCGGSENKPYCDGTHKKIGFKSE